MLVNNCYVNKEEKYDYRISLGCVLYFLMSVLNSTIKIILPDAGITSILSPLTGVVILLGYIQCFSAVWKRNNKLLLLSYFLFVIIYAVSYSLIIHRGESADVMLKGSAFLTFAWWIPLGVFAASVKELKILYYTFLKWSYALLLMLGAMFLFHPLTVYETTGYNMFFGFNMLIPTLFHLNEFIENKKIKFLVLLILELLMILIYANRGCLLAILFFILYKLFVLNKNKNRVVAMSIIGSVLLLVMFTVGSSLLQSTSNILAAYGINSRNVEMLISGSFASDATNRDIIWNDSKKMIEERPILGWGLGGEFYRLASIEGGEKVDNSFTPHNGVLQNFVNFGVVGGFLASLLFIFPYFKMRRLKNKERQTLVLIFGSSIIATFYSASGFFTNPSAAIFIYLYYFQKRRIVSIGQKNQNSVSV